MRLFLTLIFFCSTAIAQNSGRLENGQAFRIDKEGLKITDYIAELEVSLDEMRMQVAALEAEVVEKRAEIESLRSARGLSPIKNVSVKEEDVSSKIKNTSPRSLISSVANPSACRYLTVPLRQKVERLEMVLSSAKASSKSNIAQHSTNAKEMECNTAGIEAPLMHKIADLETEIKNSHAKFDSLSKGFHEAKLALKTQKESCEKRIVALSKGYQREEYQSSQQAKRQKAKYVPKEFGKAMGTASMRSYGLKNKVSTRQTEESSAKVNANNPILLSIQSLIMKRKNLIDKARSRKIKFSLSPMRTARGDSLDSLRVQLSRQGNQPRIHQGLLEIQKLLNNDIGKLKKLLVVMR